MGNHFYPSKENTAILTKLHSRNAGLEYVELMSVPSKSSTTVSFLFPLSCFLSDGLVKTLMMD